MQPVIINVTERNTLSPRGAITKSVVLTYNVGSFGPFTLVTSQEEISNGTALQKMQQFAASLGSLPQTTS
jgi:hypothetical protein